MPQHRPLTLCVSQCYMTVRRVRFLIPRSELPSPPNGQATAVAQPLPFFICGGIFVVLQDTEHPRIARLLGAGDRTDGTLRTRSANSVSDSLPAAVSLELEPTMSFWRWRKGGGGSAFLSSPIITKS